MDIAATIETAKLTFQMIRSLDEVYYAANNKKFAVAITLSCSLS
jgi:hypothetical protein